MLAISLMRIGAKGKPFYRVVVKEKRSKRDGKYLENLGTYNPMMDPALVDLKHERIQYWIGVGAQPTETVTSLIKHNPVMTDEEKAAALEARATKRAADEKARADAKKAEADRLQAEGVAAETPAADDPLAAPAAEGTEFPSTDATAEVPSGASEEGNA